MFTYVTLKAHKNRLDPKSSFIQKIKATINGIDNTIEHIPVIKTVKRNVNFVTLASIAS